MSFTFSQARRLSPEESSPYNNLISHALKQYQQGVHAKYAPEMTEANIFNKQIGPLATLASSPMFLNNPQFQHALGSLISQNLHKFGHGFGDEGHYNTYAEGIQKELNRAKKNAEKVSKAGKLATGISSAAGQAGSIFGDTASKFLNWMSGGKISNELAKSDNEIIDSLNRLKQSAIETRTMSPRDAEKTYSVHKNENPKEALTRIQKTNPNLYGPQDTYIGDEEDERAADNEMLHHSQELSQQIQQQLHKDISPNLIFNFLKKHPGDFHINDLLREVGQ